MLTISMQVYGLDEVIKSLDAVSTKLTKEIAIASWETAKKAKRLIARDVTQSINLPQKTVIKSLNAKRNSDGTSSVVLTKENQIALKYFGPKQTAAGVRVKVNKKSGFKTIPGAFMGPKPGIQLISMRGHVFKRRGKKRLPLRYLSGVSPYGYFRKSNRVMPIRDEIQLEFLKQLNRRIRYQKLRSSGGLNFQSPSYVSSLATGEN